MFIKVQRFGSREHTLVTFIYFILDKDNKKMVIFTFLIELYDFLHNNSSNHSAKVLM